MSIDKKEEETIEEEEEPNIPWIISFGILTACTMIFSIYVMNGADLAEKTAKTYQTDKDNFNNRRARCNYTILKVEGNLSEKMNTYWHFLEEPKDLSGAVEQIKNLQGQLEGTNKEVNHLRQLMACYFDE